MVDDAGRVEALRQAWLFDEFYSAFMLDDFAQAGLEREEGLGELLRQDVEALAPFDDFTRVEVTGEPQEFDAVRAYANGVARGRIRFRFELPLAEPVDPTGSELRYAVFDPTYQIELLHQGEPRVRLPRALAGRCAVEVIAPDPPAESVSLAAMLERTEEAWDGLGAQVAEWVELRCAPPR